MPATEQQRFPLLNQELIPVAEYKLKVGRILLPGWANLTVPEYPREVLVQFRDTLWQTMNLRRDPWTEVETKVVDMVGPRILSDLDFKAAKLEHFL
jgi:hypothetical protein